MNNLDDIITPTFNWLKEKNKVALATVISTWGSAPKTSWWSNGDKSER